MKSSEVRFQLMKASAAHAALHTIASEIDKEPTGLERISNAGLKMKASANRETVAV
jgi:hypothetical protein